jgi:putative chitinase
MKKLIKSHLLFLVMIPCLGLRYTSPVIKNGDLEKELGTVNTILYKCKQHKVMKFEQQAYILATAQHESQFIAQEEWGKGKNKAYGKVDNKTGQIYYGRGYVQLTWKENYERFSRELDIDLVNNPSLALQYDIAADILVIGMKKGLFTGKKLNDYINDEKTDFEGARWIVNRQDRASDIAQYAIAWYDKLNEEYEFYNPPYIPISKFDLEKIVEDSSKNDSTDWIWLWNYYEHSVCKVNEYTKDRTCYQIDDFYIV